MSKSELTPEQIKMYFSEFEPMQDGEGFKVSFEFAGFTDYLLRLDSLNKLVELSLSSMYEPDNIKEFRDYTFKLISITELIGLMYKKLYEPMEKIDLMFETAKETE